MQRAVSSLVSKGDEALSRARCQRRRRREGQTELWLFAHEYPEEVVRLVLVDAAHEDGWEDLPESVPALYEGWTDWMRLERRWSCSGVQRFLGVAPHPKLPPFVRRGLSLLRVPVILLTAAPPGVSEADFARWNTLLWEKQAEVLKLITNALQRLVTNSTYVIPPDRPNPVVEAIRQVVEVARQGGAPRGSVSE